MVFRLPLYFVAFKSDLKPNHPIAQGKSKTGQLTYGLHLTGLGKIWLAPGVGQGTGLLHWDVWVNWSIRLSQDDELVDQTFGSLDENCYRLDTSYRYLTRQDLVETGRRRGTGCRNWNGTLQRNWLSELVPDCSLVTSRSTKTALERECTKNVNIFTKEVAKDLFFDEKVEMDDEIA